MKRQIKEWNGTRYITITLIKEFDVTWPDGAEECWTEECIDNANKDRIDVSIDQKEMKAIKDLRKNQTFTLDIGWAGDPDDNRSLLFKFTGEYARPTIAQEVPDANKGWANRQYR